MKVLLVACFVFGMGFGLPVHAQTKTPTATATVAGRVTLGGEAVRELTVVLKPSVQTPPAANKELRARTDGEGRFVFTGVAAGRYTVYASSAAYVSVDDLPFGSGRATINVADGEKVEGIEVKLQRGGVITGRITDAQGRPVIEEQVQLSHFTQGGRLQTFYMGAARTSGMSQTDDRGVYRLFGLPAGRYVVSIGVPPGAPAPMPGRVFYPRTFHPGTPNEAEAKVIELALGDEATGVDITLSGAVATHRIRGRVIEAESGQPVGGIEVAYGKIEPSIGVYGERIGGWSGINARSQANGEFELSGVAPGRYGVFALLRNPSDVYSEPVVCEVKAGDVGNAELKLVRGGALSGTVTITGTRDPAVLSQLEKMRLYYYVTSEKMIAPTQGETRVNPDGTFAITGLPAGRVMLLPRELSTRLHLTRIEREGATQAQGIALSAGEKITGVRLIFEHGTLAQRGEVKFSGGAPPAGLRLFVNFSRLGQNRYTVGADVDARGQFVVEGLTAGEYVVRLEPFIGMGRERPGESILARFRAAGQNITVTGNNPPLVLMVDLSRQGGSQ